MTSEPPKQVEEQKANPNVRTGMAEPFLPRRGELIQSFPKAMW